jgi:hypothetical protein
MALSFHVSYDDHVKINKLVDRALSILNDDSRTAILVTKFDLGMSLTACIASGTPLDLDGLLAAEDRHVAHDVFGINRYIDRDTGKLGGHFTPRFAAPIVPTETRAQPVDLYDPEDAADEIECRRIELGDRPCDDMEDAA